MARLDKLKHKGAEIKDHDVFDTSTNANKFEFDGELLEPSPRLAYRVNAVLCAPVLLRQNDWLDPDPTSATYNPLIQHDMGEKVLNVRTTSKFHFDLDFSASGVPDTRGHFHILSVEVRVRGQSNFFDRTVLRVGVDPRPIRLAPTLYPNYPDDGYTSLGGGLHYFYGDGNADQAIPTRSASLTSVANPTAPYRGLLDLDSSRQRRK